MPFGLSVDKFNSKLVSLDEEDKQGPSDDDEEQPPEDDGDVQPPEEDDVSVPSGQRVGIVGWDVAANNRARCILCLSKQMPDDATVVRKGDDRFWWRAGPTRLEKSLHASCVLDGSLRRWPEATEQMFTMSIRFLRCELAKHPTSQLLADALNVMSLGSGSVLGSSSSSST